MPKKNKLPTHYPYEIIYWVDADGNDRQPYDPEESVLVTGGFLTSEGKHTITIVWEYPSFENWRDSENIGYRKIPKGCILRRIRTHEALPVSVEEGEDGGRGEDSGGAGHHEA